MPTKFRNPRKTDWIKFRNTLSELTDQSLAAISSRKELDIECERLRKSIMQAYKANCPLSSPPSLGKRSAWSVELSEKKKKARKSFNAALWEAHHKCKKEYNDARRISDRNEWKNFTAEVEIYRIMAKLKYALAKDPFQPEIICDENGTPITTNEEALEVLLKKHFPGIEADTAVHPVNNVTTYNRSPRRKETSQKTHHSR